MNNKIHPSKDHHSSFQLLDISAYIESFNLDPKQTSISLKIINGMSFSFNWSTGKFNYLRQA
ncbi:MAG: hypothetical protein KMY55_16660 [Dethiosulfatibacter sp.]|nr:hypothetical protein [Dethiosulfatibacter sp.]